MGQFRATVASNRRIGDGFYEMALSWGAMAGAPHPGQFLTVRVSGDTVPLLRRPFAFAGFDEAARVASVIYQVRGRGTELLAGLAAGEEIDVIGPLGNVFPVGGDDKRAVAVAGGVGLGPILFLVSELRKQGVETEFVFGCRGEALIPDSALFRDAGARICTDDGSAGFRGNVVEYINTNIKLDGGTVVYGCGPEVMLKSLCGLTERSGAKGWMSLEAMMACGVGACMGCVVKTASGYQRVCKEGPVFDGGEIVWG
ncbi:MAG: dihydroorotate dehydrogenase electron transfer subunit [Chitinispirillia bacterium]|nr:dihydroorotate dehydrogenase electron transfer subunit [Chitinispirillia bacterium]MCL2242274.1 dihydroorotate dehydrogenase electron transfer subunit [Chitinispirillia bacterium]